MHTYILVVIIVYIHIYIYIYIYQQRIPEGNPGRCCDFNVCLGSNWPSKVLIWYTTPGTHPSN